MEESPHSHILSSPSSAMRRRGRAPRPCLKRSAHGWMERRQCGRPCKAVHKVWVTKVSESHERPVRGVGSVCLVPSSALYEVDQHVTGLVKAEGLDIRHGSR